MTTGMRKEIGQIPAVVERIVAEGGPQLDEVVAAIRRLRPRWTIVVARGTSDHAAIYARYAIEARLGMPVSLAAPSITTMYGSRLDWRDVLLLAISQSGEGPDVTAVTEAARAGGALTVAITNEPRSPLSAAAEWTLDCRAGRERSVAATKTYAAQLALVAALVGKLAPRTGISAGLATLHDTLERVVETCETWLPEADALVASLASKRRALILSRGFNMATALEVALKLKETSRIFAEGYSTADLLHGPVVLAGPAVPMLVFRPRGRTGRMIDEDVARARSAGGRPWVVSDGPATATPGRRRGTTGHARHSAQRLRLPVSVPEILSPLPFVIPGLLLAEAVARRSGNDPDAPAGLTKVTRTR